MNLRFLETFVWAARLRKMTLVAQRLHATDATISARIAALEDELGVKVFVREKGQQLSLTAIGAEMLQPAEELLAMADAFTTRFTARNRQISIGMSGTVERAILHPLVNALHAQWPDVHTHLPSLTSTEIRRKLLAGEIDIGLLLGCVDDRQVVNLKLMELDYVWVASPRLVPAGVRAGTEELRQFTFLSYPRDSDLFASIAAYFEAPGLAGFRINALSSLSVMIRLACAGVGYAVLPLSLIGHELDTGQLRILDSLPAFPTQSYYAAYIDLPSTPLRRAMAECIHAIASSYSASASAASGSLPC